MTNMRNISWMRLSVTIGTQLGWIVIRADVGESMGKKNGGCALAGAPYLGAYELDLGMVKGGV